jgi:hypothetical protein
MLWVTVITLAVMLIYAVVAAEAVKRGDRQGESASQGTVSLGWIILAGIVVVAFARGC